MAVMVTGGAGYIGSHTAAELMRLGREVVVVDSLLKGHKKAAPGGRLRIGDIRDETFMDRVFAENNIDSVIHFAGDIEAGLSVKDPLAFYRNNVYTAVCLIDSMVKHGVKDMVFSSSAAVYGHPKEIPIGEVSEKSPVNPYGETKLAVEKMLRWCGEAYGTRWAALRYFNAAGAHESGEIGEDHDPESHLIPLILQAAMGRRESVQVFGQDYDTPDGTCVRDYIHVCDLGAAHVLALDYLKSGGKPDSFNLGSGSGYSVMEVIDKAKEVTGREFRVDMLPRREGDPARLVADTGKAGLVLGWHPENGGLGKIIESAWRWHTSHPNGYEG